jgi:ABC-2 type transport system permease protein
VNPVVGATRLGLARGWTEFRQRALGSQDMAFNVFFAIVVLVVLGFQRSSTVPGTSLPLAMVTLPSILGMHVAMGGFIGAASTLTVEREDGTLLRAKTVPHGMVGYVVGQVVSTSLLALTGLVVIVVPGLFLVPELADTDALGWLTFAWVVALGLVATLPLGAIVGSLASNPNALFGFGMLPMVALTAISGIFYPISALPDWIQGVAQLFPVYWLGLGMRSAFLPDAAGAVEIAGSWRTLQTVAMLTAWAAVGLVLAPGVLRRMARRESGSAVSARRQAAMQRTG